MNPQITQIEVRTGSGSDRVLWQDDCDNSMITRSLPLPVLTPVIYG